MSTERHHWHDPGRSDPFPAIDPDFECHCVSENNCGRCHCDCRACHPLDGIGLVTTYDTAGAGWHYYIYGEQYSRGGFASRDEALAAARAATPTYRTPELVPPPDLSTILDRWNNQSTDFIMHDVAQVLLLALDAVAQGSEEEEALGAAHGSIEAWEHTRSGATKPQPIATVQLSRLKADLRAYAAGLVSGNQWEIGEELLRWIGDDPNK